MLYFPFYMYKFHLVANQGKELSEIARQLHHTTDDPHGGGEFEIGLIKLIVQTQLVALKRNIHFDFAYCCITAIYESGFRWSGLFTLSNEILNTSLATSNLSLVNNL